MNRDGGDPRLLHPTLHSGNHTGVVMLTYNAFFQQELQKLLVKEMDRLKENLSLGLSTPDFATYKHQVGVIEGLRKALELTEEAESIANGAER